VAVAGNGEEALRHLEEEAPFDLVLMDVQMPVMDGLEATRTIRSWARSGHPARARASTIPVIAMTAHAMKTDRERCMQAGMNDYISKPIEPVALFETISRWKENRIMDHSHVVTPLTSEGEKYPVDLEDALRRVDGDREFLEEILLNFVSRAPDQAAAIETFLGRNDARALTREAHSLKGAAGNLGAKQVAELARQLEQIGREDNLESGRALIQDLWEALDLLNAFVHQPVWDRKEA
jgi:CheY-like chemotaxis protein